MSEKYLHIPCVYIGILQIHLPQMCFSKVLSGTEAIIPVTKSITLVYKRLDEGLDPLRCTKGQGKWWLSPSNGSTSQEYVGNYKRETSSGTC